MITKDDKFSKQTLDKLFTAIENKSYSTGEVVVVGELFELKFDDDGSAVSIYKYRPQEEREKLDESDEGYNYDDDFITTIYL